MAADTDAPASSSSGGGNLLTRKLGPLPTWAWLAIATVLGLMLYLYEKSHAASSATASTATTASTAAAAGVPQNVQVFQNYGQTPATTPAPKPKPTGKPAPAAPPATSSTTTNYTMPAATSGTIASSSPQLDGLTLAAAVAALQKAGWGISSVSYAGQPVTTAQYSSYASTPIYSYTPGPNNTVAIGLQ
jgi:hypothetical protein